MMIDMEQEYDFNGVGKRMPYSVPDNFFVTLEENVMQQVAPAAQQPGRRAKVLKMIVRASIAAAACLMVFVGYKAFFKTETVDSYMAMEQAFANLSEEDQDFLLEVYLDDVFMEDEDIYYDI